MLTEKDNPKIQEQYSKWVYPEPIKDLDEWRKSGKYQSADPNHLFNLFWPNKEKQPLEILVAGCGTYQGACYAYSNRDCAVTAIDISNTSIQHTRDLKERHQLKNLDLIEMSLHDVGKLNRKFDLIVSTGVLHHLPDPVAGGVALADALKSDGVMSLMLYGSTLRAGIYMLQEAFRAIGLEQTQNDVDLIKEMRESLPPNHAVQKFFVSSMDWNKDGGIVDLFLNPQDRAYSVPDIYSFAEEIGLKFQGWLDPGGYAIDNFLLPNFPGFDRLKSLPLKAQATFVDNFFQLHGTHRFNLCHLDVTEHEISFEGDDWLSYVPQIRLGLQQLEPADFANGKKPVWRRGGLTFELGPLDQAVLKAIDGKTNAATCIKKAVAKLDSPPENATQVAKNLLSTMWDRGHIFFKKG